VEPSFLYSVPLEIAVILKCVTSLPSTALRDITRPLVVWVSSLVDALVTDGVSATGLTVIVALTVLPPRPPSAADVDACTVYIQLPNDSALGVIFNPALRSAIFLYVPLFISVVPSFLYSVPSVIAVILKCVTSLPSAALREITRPLVVCVSSLVVA